MANVQLPKRFSDKLAIDQALDGIVKTTLSSFGDILDQNHLYFFKEYTNHGIKHIQNVLESSDNLITDETYSKVLGDKDIGCYILSVILHDIGMHIDIHGVQCLIDGDFDPIRIKELDNHTWKYLWNDFLNEARKFSGRQLRAIFGDENTIVREPPISHPNEITEADKMLIGEFIRRHHARLAHEIAIKGFPAKPNFLEFANNFDSKGKNLIGLIARSHGTGLRQCLDYIESIYGRNNRRFPNGIHATYLMVLLRIADYIQIDSGRTSKTLLRTKTFSSPISELEHNAHIAIDNIDYRWHDDPERIFVSASPKNSRMYLKLRKLIKDIQFEFDLSWAVLGELYGKREDDDKPLIKYRRISSNLEDPTFTEQQTYVTDNFSFKSNDEIIKLLVAPLYGNDPKYGVRELLQNAVDACRERQELEKRESSNYKPSIKIEIQKDGDFDYFKIIDNGIGMDIDVIKNFFLSAGASYRKSMTWQKSFIGDNGKSLVRRSGRFGVGILAAFLIGEEIYVETKKISHQHGHKFYADLNSDQIDVLKDDTISEGTSIRIQVSLSASKKIRAFKEIYVRELSWYDWYSLSNPMVQYFLDSKEIIPYKLLNPDDLNALPIEWQAIDSEGYDKIIWTYHNKTSKINFTCNGIVVPELDYNSLDLGLISNTPQISVFDSNAFLPLTLDRNTCSERLTFSEELLEDIYKDVIAYLLIHDEISFINGNEIHYKNNKLNHPGLINSISYNWEAFYGMSYYKNDSETRFALKEFLNTILVSKNGFILNYNFFLRKLGRIDAVYAQINPLKSGILTLDVADKFVILSENKLNAIPDYVAAIESRNWNASGIYESFSSRVFMKSEKHQFIFEPGKKRTTAWLNRACKVEFEKFGFTCLTLGNPKSSIVSESFLEQNAKSIHFIREFEIACPFDGDAILNRLLERYLGDNVIIPYSIDERKTMYPLAFKELEVYMKKYPKKT